MVSGFFFITTFFFSMLLCHFGIKFGQFSNNDIYLLILLLTPVGKLMAKFWILDLGSGFWCVAVDQNQLCRNPFPFY